jgi:hypothetical protein
VGLQAGAPVGKTVGVDLSCAGQRGLSALAEHQALTFGPIRTVVCSDNAAGDTGHVRILEGLQKN